MRTIIPGRFLVGKASFRPSQYWLPTGFLILAAVIGFSVARMPMLWATFSLVSATVFLLVLVQPLVGIALALLAGPFGALENVLLGGSPLDSGQLLLLLTVAAWLGTSLRRRRIVLRHFYLSVPLLIFLLAAAVSLLNAPSLAVGLKELLKWIEIYLIAAMVVDLVGQSGRGKGSGQSLLGLPPIVELILLMLLVAGLSQALVGIWQFGLRGTGPEHFAILDRFYRAYGTFEQPNPFGGFMNLTALLAVGVLIGLASSIWTGLGGKAKEDGNATPSRSTRFLPASSASNLVKSLLIAFSALGTILALVFSWSRGAWLGMASGLVVLFLLWPKNWRQMLLLLTVVAVLVGSLLFIGNQLDIIPDGLLRRLGDFGQDLRFGDVRGVDINDSNYAVLERLAHWQAALNMAQNNFWLGVGFGNYEAAYAEYALINWPDALGHAHNYYLNILAEAGIVGLSAYLLFWLGVFWQTLRLVKRLDWPVRGIALGLLAAWVSLSVHHFVDKLYVNNIYIHLGVMLGLLQVLSSGMEASARPGMK
jgi:O-antigen ligase